MPELTAAQTSHVLYALDDLIARETDPQSEDVSTLGMAYQQVRAGVQATCPTCDPSEPPPAS